MTQDATQQNLRIRCGDDWGDEVTITCVDGDGNPLDLTGAEIWMTVRKKALRNASATDTSHPPVLQITSPAVVGGAGGITIIDGPAGTARPSLTPAQTKLLVKSSYVYDIQLRAATGSLAGKVKTIQEGTITPLAQNTLSA
jgi:hypothetical protein